MHNLPHTQELDGLAHIRLLYQAQNIVISSAGLLLCCHIFHQIRNRVTCHLKLCGSKRKSGSRLRPYTDSMVNIIICKTTPFDFFHGQISCQLMHDSCHYLQMSQLLSADICQKSCHFTVRHGIALRQITHTGPHLSVRSAVLRNNCLRQHGIWFLDVYRKFQSFLITPHLHTLSFPGQGCFSPSPFLAAIGKS